jgi:CitB family two-component system response regulator CitT
MKVLIVDDNSSFLELFELYAENYPQFDFIYGKSGREALEILESEKNNDISLVISDVRMPATSGIDLVRIIKEKYPKMSIMIITGLELSLFSDQEFSSVIKLLNKNIGCEGILKEIKSFSEDQEKQ